MAHAKTTPAQVAAQLAAGAAVAGYLYKTFYYDRQQEAPAAAAAQAQPGSAPASTQQQQQAASSVVAALDAEAARSTAGRVWEAKRAAVDAPAGKH